tara:strand:+ start:883 stop:1272 length:390 start_codon:yes stop_codon:yes gene_type:complete
MINIVVIISLILNAVLIASVVGWLPLSMFLSGLLNIGLLWYLRNLFLQIEERNEDMVEMFEQLEHFSVHLEDIHGLEMFYGDETLQSLITHSKTLLNNFDEYYERYSDEELEDEEEEVIAPTPSQEEEE